METTAPPLKRVTQVALHRGKEGNMEVRKKGRGEEERKESKKDRGGRAKGKIYTYTTQLR